MIQANELRIGNIVKGIYICEDYIEKTDTYEDKTVDVICKVLGLDSTGAYDWPIVLEAINKSEFKHQITEYDNVVGIPLTEDILLRCGFKLLKDDEDYEIFVLSGFIICMSINGFYSELLDQNGFKSEIKYLHQLQNLFYSLTGKELLLQPLNKS